MKISEKDFALAVSNLKILSTAIDPNLKLYNESMEYIN